MAPRKIDVSHELRGRVLFEPAEDEDPNPGCCMGSAVYGPDHCTCWEPVFEQVQAPPRTDEEPTTREKCCDDCAYRNGSPEREDDYEEEFLRDLSGDARHVFWCHTGFRRPIEYRHPDGRTRPGDPADYQPAVVGGVGYQADGSPGERCAGWAAYRRGLGLPIS